MKTVRSVALFATLSLCLFLNANGSNAGVPPGGGNVFCTGTPTNGQVPVFTGNEFLCVPGNASGGTPGGTPGQVQFNNSGSFGGFTLGGNGSLNTSTGALTVTGASGNFTADGSGAAIDLSPPAGGTVTINPGTQSNIDNIVLGFNTPRNGFFNDLSAFGAGHIYGAIGGFPGGQVLELGGASPLPTFTANGQAAVSAGQTPNDGLDLSGQGSVSDISLFNKSNQLVANIPTGTTGFTFVSVPTLPTQTANTVFAGPTTGSAAIPAFRAIVPADLPLGSSSAFGAVKCDGTTITCTSGVISSGGGSSGALTKLCTVTLTTTPQAAVEFKAGASGCPSFTGYNAVTLVASNLLMASGGSGKVYIQFCVTTCASYDTGTDYFNSAFAYNASLIDQHNFSDNGIYISSMSAVGGEAAINFTYNLTAFQEAAYSGTQPLAANTAGASFVNNSGPANQYYQVTNFGGYISTGPVTGLRIFSSGNNFDCLTGQTCTVTLYGLTP